MKSNYNHPASAKPVSATMQSMLSTGLQFGEGEEGILLLNTLKQPNTHAYKLLTLVEDQYFIPLSH